MEQNLKVVSQLSQALFKWSDSKLEEELAHLVQLNNSFTDTPAYGFTLYGSIFSVIPPKFIKRKLKYPPLHPTLLPLAQEYALKKSKLRSDKIKVEKALILIVIKCNHWSELLGTLPKSLVHLLNESPNAESKLHLLTPIELHTYQQILPLIESYSIEHLLG